MQYLKVAVIQANLFWEDIAANLQMFEQKLTLLQSDTAVVFLPEMFSTGFSMNADNLAEKIDGNTIAWMQDMAARYKTIIAGSLIIEQDRKYYNRFLWVSANGIQFQYDKRHLFRMGAEDEHYSAGNNNDSFNALGWKWRPQICYDLRFPVWHRNTDEYEVLIFVANWPQRRIEHWKALLQARAIENQCYVIGVNRVGFDGNKVYHNGCSGVISPQGDLLAGWAEDDESILYSTLDKEVIEQYRNLFPVWKDADDFKLNLS